MDGRRNPDHLTVAKRRISIITAISEDKEDMAAFHSRWRDDERTFL